jgi:hypothetical protein
MPNVAHSIEYPVILLNPPAKTAQGEFPKFDWMKNASPRPNKNNPPMSMKKRGMVNAQRDVAVQDVVGMVREGRKKLIFYPQQWCRCIIVQLSDGIELPLTASCWCLTTLLISNFHSSE